MRRPLVAVAALCFLAGPAFAQGAPTAGATTPAPTASPNAMPGSPGPQQPPPAQTLPPAAGAAQPSYPYPPAYPYPPGYPYSPAYGYPAPSPYAPGYPTYPQGYSPYASPYPTYPPAYGPAAGYRPPVVAEPAPSPLPGGRLRIGAALVLMPQGTLSYSLIDDKGEPLLAYSGSTAGTAGVVPFVQFDLHRYLYLAFAVQFLPSVKWNFGGPASSSNNNLFGGTGREVDFLPQLGVTVPAARRLRLLVFAAPGYSLLFASNLVNVYADPGTAHGFIFQTGFGLIWALGQHGFLDFRGAYQWGFQNNTVQSPTTGESADVEVHSRFFGLQAGSGYWF